VLSSKHLDVERLQKKLVFTEILVINTSKKSRRVLPKSNLGQRISTRDSCENSSRQGKIELTDNLNRTITMGPPIL